MPGGDGGEDDKRTLANLRKRRGVAKASITRLETRLRALEAERDEDTIDNARQLLARLKVCTAEFKELHLAIIDYIEGEGPLDAEQAVLDEHDDITSSMFLRVQKLVTSLTPPTPTKIDSRTVISRRLKQTQESLSAIRGIVGALSGEAKNIHRLKLHEEQLADLKKNLSDVNLELVSLDLTEGDELVETRTTLEQLLFDCSLKVKELLATCSSTTATLSATTSTSTDTPGVKLPKLDVPTFSGNVLQWSNFWEQFVVSVHDRPTLSNTEKLVYLQQALKGGSAKSVVEGLSSSGDSYEEAIKCLRARYDRPRLIHQAHVKAILEASPLRDGTGKEIRKLHDTLQQHLRALKAMGYDPPGPFITSTVELKLDTTTMFEWQRHSQEAVKVPDYHDLLDFLDLRARASESLVEQRRPKVDRNAAKKSAFKAGAVASFAANTENSPNQASCILCKSEKHPLYACPKFRSMTHDAMMSTLKSNNLCMNCLGPNHFVKSCKSLHRCKQCQKPHHTLLHVDQHQSVNATPAVVHRRSQVLDSNPVALTPPEQILSSHASTVLKADSLLMTCRVLVKSPDGTWVEARALLDNASSASFVSERLAQSLQFPRHCHNLRISGIVGLSRKSPFHSITTFTIAPIYPSEKKIDVTAVVVPQVTCDLPLHPISPCADWTHLNDLSLADPGFGHPGKIDMLLGIDVFVEVLCHGRRTGPPNSPVAFETKLGWVLAGPTQSSLPIDEITTHHTLCLSSDDLLRKFWEIEETPLSESTLSPEERKAMQHFEANHSRNPNGRFVVPLPKREDARPLGESRSQALRRFVSLERSLRSREQFDSLNDVMQEYFTLNHAEPVPAKDLSKSPTAVFYLPMHAVHKQSSTTTKIRAVFDASMKTSTGVSLNDTLMVGPTIHPSLVDVLLRFRMHRIALVADISKMYRAIELPEADRDLHRFLWRSNPDDPVQDCRMTRVTFGVSSSAFVANMSVRQNAEDYAHKYPLAAKVVKESFYVDDCLTGADTIEEGIELQTQLHNLFSEADFL